MTINSPTKSDTTIHTANRDPTMGALTEVFSNFLLFFLVFGMSATVDIDKLRKQLGNPHALLTGVSLQFLILPFVGFVVVKLFRFSAPVGITLLVVTSSPGGSYCNWWCSLFNAELALSVTMTAVSTALSVIMLPVNLIMYSSGSYSSAVVKSLDWYALFMSLFVVIGGISSGLFCSTWFKDSPEQSARIHKAANRFGNVAGILLITYSILVSSSDHKAALWDQSWHFFVGIAIPAVVGITLATFMATHFKLEKPERVAVAVESCYQNTAFLLATFCIICWKLGWTKAPSDENFCVMLSTSYEVAQAEAVAQATSIDAVLRDISSSENNDLELAIEDTAVEKPQIVFEETETEISSAADDEQDTAPAAGAAVLRKIACDDVEDQNVFVSPKKPQSKGLERAGSPPAQEGDVDASSREVGRFGKTISFVNAKARGYRRAPLPNEEDDNCGSCDRIPESVELPIDNSENVDGSNLEGPCEDTEQRLDLEQPRQAQQVVEDSPSTETTVNIILPDATPAEGKTID